MREPFPFQARGVAHIKATPFALLYDEQGLGKTTQAIMAYADYPAPKVVVCPLILARQWQNEIKTITNEDAVIVNSKGTPTGPGWTIVSYERLSWVRWKPGFVFIIDEATYIKNWKTKRAKLVANISAAASRVLALTGTPMVNRPKDLWMLMLVLRRYDHREFMRFMNTYCGAYRTPYGWDFDGATNLEELSRELSKFGLRRTKREVLAELPPKLHTTLSVDADIADAVVEILALARTGDDLSSARGLASIQGLRIKSANSKVQPVAEWLEERVGENDTRKIVVFSAFKEPLRKLAMLLGYPEERVITGDESSTERFARIEAWKESNVDPILYITYGTGTYGLNLQVADTVVLLDLPWTPSDLEQAEDRVHRIGQTSSVEIVTALAEHPIELQMLSALRLKRDMRDAILGYAHEALKFEGGTGLSLAGL